MCVVDFPSLRLSSSYINLLVVFVQQGRIYLNIRSTVTTLARTCGIMSLIEKIKRITRLHRNANLPIRGIAPALRQHRARIASGGKGCLPSTWLQHPRAIAEAHSVRVFDA